MARKRCEKARCCPPDLILMDLAMPVLNGREAMELLASDPVTAQVPVLAMSAQANVLATPDEGQRFIPKPAEPEHLLEQIRVTLRGGAA